MSTMTLKSLVDKLSPGCKKSLEAAAALCNSKTHTSVEIHHWLSALLEQPDDTLNAIVHYFDIDAFQLNEQLQQKLDRFETGCSQPPGLSSHIVTLLRTAWMSATIDFADDTISVVHIVYALVSDDSLGAMIFRDIPQLARVEPQRLIVAWPEIAPKAAGQAELDGSEKSLGISQQALEQFTIDLTEQAREQKLDPILGRDHEIRQMIDILTRRRQNNPMLTGEAGVGKTAVVEGLAQRIVQGDVPESLRDISIKVLDLALLQAGAGMKGEFESRLKSLIKEVKQSSKPIVLFIDEAHTLIGSGGQAGQNDAANLLKPALARGELRTIAATTWAEYKKFFEKDAALTRRFQVVKVEEPDEETAVVMLRGLLPVMESHHNVMITDKALQAAVKLSNRYISGKQLPDKAVSLLDTACARVAMSQVSVPSDVELLIRQQQQAEAELAILEKELVTGATAAGRIAELKAQQDSVATALELKRSSWQAEKELVTQARRLSHKLIDQTEEDSEADLQTLLQIKERLDASEKPMVFFQVDEALVAEVISDWTGIPLGRMQSDEIETILTLDEQLKERVIGQDHALALMSKVVQTARVGLSDEQKPNGVFLLTGPSGVGKTESALALAEQIYGSEDNVIVINMSEFKEEHKVSLLLGSPPGYVGYGEGGVLTEAVRRNPYSVILLDEMEKAHPGVQDIFYQVFDKGTIKDGEGREIDFKNTIIIMTSNVGTETTLTLFEDDETAPTIQGLKEALNDDLLTVFKPAFLGRANVVPYLPLNQVMLKEIIRLQLEKVSERISKNYQATLNFSDSISDLLIDRCMDNNAGARNVINFIQSNLLPVISSEILYKVSAKESIEDIMVDYVNNDFIINITC
ncbi:type VI secretion system ATPase TssH [Photobacterium sp. TY1-4]|uniref:type VI secretion system ATPase TssH n=1 Tax=Photobacterium sp. TY1-4 TaxID=2899122 RepID=UPI0021BEB0E5|nr:type VI secretion system ATPase TssH [Photobacterium sp. TY1-4]UXI02693.1 type VI secretion system ATPase TssH [Photobacterium sp. TY1-4]